MSSPPRGSAAAGLPAWKQAILERKRAKLAAGLELPKGPSPPPVPSPGMAAREEEGAKEERLVVAESLGPLRENPFMRLESERRRRRRRRIPEPPPTPEPPALSQLLELYSAMPGIRTIRADNILIIESRGEEEPDAKGPGGESPLHWGGGADHDVIADPPLWRRRRRRRPEVGRPPSSPSPPPLRHLLSRSGSPVTEIRAAEVVIYEPQPATRTPPSPAAEPPEAEPGLVSRLLQKFDSRRPRGGNVGSRGGRWRGGEASRPEIPQAAGAAVPNTYSEEALPSLASASLAARPDSPHSLQPSGGFVQKIGANSFTVNPRGRRFPGPAVSGHMAATPVLSNGPVESEEAGLPRAQGLQGASAITTSPKPVPSPSARVALSPTRANLWNPKSEEAVEAAPLLLPPPMPSASPDSSATAGLPRSMQPFGSSGTFEIRPAAKPDLDAIPAHDLQAQALASLRLNSRNSFLFVPRRKGEVPGAPEPREALPALPGGALPAAPEKQAETLVPVTYIDEDLVEPESGRLPPLKVLSPRLEGFDVPHEGNLVLEMDDSVLPMFRSHPAGFAAFSQKNGNTFTIVPKRKPPSAGLETFNRAWLPEEEEEEEEGQAKARADTPHQELGRLLKKRYPTVNEIEVIGGYLSLDKSCMSKSGAQRKKMKISFNETSLQTMFEYPSESSLVEEEEEEEEEEYATEVDETPMALFIPRPTGTRHANTTNSVGLSSYTPKHSLEFGKWQEKQYDGTPPSPGALLQDSDLSSNQVMLTPADKSSLADFSSEPALYF